jgi:hypothetical protein
MSPEDIMLNYFFHEPNYNCKCNPEYLDFSEVQDYGKTNASINNSLSDTLQQNEAHLGHRQDQSNPSQSIKGSNSPILMPFSPSLKNKIKKINTKVISLDESHYYNEETDFE